MPALDQIESIRAVDKEGMAELLKEFPQRVDAAFARELPGFNFISAGVRSIAVVGMGGSAIGGDLAVAMLTERLTVPVEVLRTAHLPAWAGKEALVIAVSYSGNTAETLTAYDEARRRGCAIAAVSSGGILAESAKRDHVPYIQVGAYPQPRLAVGDLTVAVLGILVRVCGGALEGMRGTVRTALNAVQAQCLPAVPTDENPAKFLAYRLFDRLPVVAGGGALAPVARRWKTQVNENAKSVCVAETVPELLHNTIEGLKNPPRFADDSTWVLLEAPGDPAMPAGQLEKLAQFLRTAGVLVERIRASESDPSAAVWRLVYLGDWVSFYLACLQGVDPMPVPAIQAFKKV
jgi:glucose/mannose-6-phosphate isomerase